VTDQHELKPVGLDVQVEYTVEECSSENRAKNDCVDVKVTKEVLPHGGNIVFAVGHQHAGGIGTSLHGQVASTYIPIYTSSLQTEKKILIKYEALLR